MSNDIRDILYPDEPNQPRDAFVSSRASMARPLPKRFYALASVAARDGAYAVVLDGKPALTPARNLLALATEAAAAIIAEEWNARTETINPLEMHATRIANVGIDRVAAVREDVIDDAVKYARSDLVCYRAGAPEGLIARESARWDPVLQHVRHRHGAQFVLSQGIGYATQAAPAVAAVRSAVAAINDPVALAAFHTLTTLSGSVLIALAMTDGALTPEAAFDAASVEEDWNAHLWGEDAEAEARRARRRAEFLQAAALFRSLA